MAVSRKLQDDLEELKNDASKVLTDISKLTKNIPEAAKNRAEIVEDQVIANMKEQLGQLSSRITEFSNVLKQQMAHADRHVHNNPYLYIAGAIGLGTLLGKSFLRRERG